MMPASSPSKSPVSRVALTALLAFASALWPKLSFPASVLCLVVWLSLPELAPHKRIQVRLLLAFGALASTVGVLRFVLEDAIPGVLAGGKTAVKKQAVSFLRTIVTAQDHARSRAWQDSDGDGVGEALSLRQLAGLDPVTSNVLPHPPLAVAATDFIESPRGLILRRGGYLFQQCRPIAAGTLAADGEGTLDAERAEREFVVYAWPGQAGSSAPKEAYFINEHEAIQVLAPPLDAPPRYVGILAGPTCGSALVKQEGLAWSSWKDKQPRATLPGDRR